MSKYTTEVRFICETYAGLDESKGLDDVNEIIHECHNKVMGAYPIFDEAYRETLNAKILKHYYTREICAETVGLWRLWLNNRMNEIMPYYNQLYKSTLLEFNPFYDTDLSTEHTRDEDGENTNTSENNEERNAIRSNESDFERNGEENVDGENNKSSMSSTENIKENSVEGSNSNSTSTKTNGKSNRITDKQHSDKYSDTPQGGLTGIENDTYLTNVRLIGEGENDTENNEQTGSASGSTSYSESGSNKENADSVSNEVGKENVKRTNSEGGRNSEIENNKSSYSGSRNDTNKFNTTEAYLERVHGKRGSVSYSKLLQEYRDTFINIDKMVIEELADLFFNLW